MRKIYSLLLALVLFSAANINAQIVNVTNPGNATPAFAATYASLAAAITDVNNRTAISGPVTLTLTAAQTAPAGGYVIQNAAITGGSNTNRITFDGGAQTITAGVGTSTTNDAIIKIIGTDFITVQNFVLNEAGTNLTATTQVEWGIAVLYATTTNGSQGVTLQNNTITLNRTNVNTFGIYSNSTHTNAAPTTGATATTAAGGNSNLKIYSNTISNVNMGIVVVGPTAAADANTGVEIGGASLGNTISNFGTSNAISSYANVSGTVNGILVRNSNGFVISNNSITSSAGGVTAGTLNGIQVPAASATPTTTFTNNINNNTIALQSGLASGAINGINYPSGSASTTSILNINSNNFTQLNHSLAASGVIIAVLVASTNLTTSISNNTFTNISTNTTGNFTFISASYTAPANGTKTINGNSIVTAFNKTGAGGTVALYFDGGSSTTGTSVQNNNNNFSNITLTGATIITGWFNNDGTGSTPAKTITGNTFSNWTCGTGAVNVLQSNFGGSTNMSNNTISSITGGSTITAINQGSSGTIALLTIANNSVTSVSSTGGTVVGIATASGATAVNVNGNTIRTLSSTTSNANGITLTAGTTINMFKNTICDLLGSAASSVVTGLTVAGTTNTIYNNRIADLRTPIANAANTIVGISITGGTTINVYYNSVYLNGSSTGLLFGSSAISVNTAPTVTFINNIFHNASGNAGAGLAAAYRRSSTTLTSYGANSNNNNFFGSTIFTDGTNTDAGIVAYKTRVASRDAASFSENTSFLSTTCGDANFLKINTATPTQLESGGVNVSGITDDFEADARNGSTPDIGADEFAGTALDLIAPSITGIALAGNPCNLVSRTVTATISDASGVNNALFQPRIYFRKNAGAYSSAAGSLSSGTVNSGSWTFTITYATLGGVAAPDVIDYFIVAQDINGNAGGNPSSGLALTNVNTVTTPPTTPLTYTIQNSLSGTYTVGAAGTYTTLTAAIAAYNTSCLAGAVTFSLVDAAYTEASAMTINANADASATNTLTIKPTLANTTIAVTGGSATAIFVLNGADYVTINGSINNTANTVCPASAASRDLTITNTSTSTSSAVVWLQTATGANAATNNAVINCNLVGNSNTTTVCGVGSGSPTISTASLGTGNNNNVFVNNDISKTVVGVYSQGASGANKNTGNTINQNRINTASPNNVRRAGVLVGFESSLTVSGNLIDGIASAATTEDVFGISLGGLAISTGTFTGNEVTNSTITKNVIGSVRQTNTYSAAGIFVAPAASGTNLIANNMISGVSANGTSGDFTAGILIGGGAGSTTNIYYNTVVQQGTQTGGSDKTYGLAIGGSNPIVDLRNNIFVNTQNNGTGINYAVGIGYSTFTNLTSDNNNFYTTTGALYAVGGTASLVSPTTAVTFANFQTATGKDAASKNVLPVFVSGTDLHLDNNNNPLLDGAGALVSVVDDIDCQTRSIVSPDLGADEFAAPGCVTAVGGTATGDATFCGSGTPAITNTGFSTGTGSGYQWYSSTNIADYPNAGTAVGGQTNPASLATGVVSTTTYYWLRVTCATNTSTDNSTLVTITVNPNPTAPVTPAGPVTICTPATQLLDASGTNASSPVYQWRNNNVDLGGETNATYTASASGSYTVRVEDGVTGCFTISSPVSVTVNQSPDAVAIAPLSATICAGGSVNLTASGGGIAVTAAQIGFGTSTTTASTTSSTLGPNPLQSYYGGAKQQMIVLASELTALGMANGSEISSISFNLSVAETGRVLQNLQVKMSTTALSAFASTTFQPAGTVVRNAANLTVAAGWNAIAFDNNFTWNGTDNLLIEVNFSNNDGGGSGTSTAVYSTTAFASTLFYRVDNNTASAVDGATTASFAAYTQRNNMQFNFTTPASFVWTPAASGLDVYTGPNVVATPAGTITYTATTTFNGCPSFSNVLVTVNPNYDIVATSGPNGTVAPLGTTTLSCDGTGDQTYTITPDPGYEISDLIVDGTPNTVLTTGTYATGGTYDFINVTANHTISATFALACVNVGITNVTASNPGPLCSGQTTNLTANGVVGTNAVVNWWTGPNGTGTNVGTGTTLNGVGANTYYARVTGDCGTPQEASITINSIGNTFTGTGNWTDNARWSCGTPPSSGDAVTIAAGAVCTLNTNFLVSGSLTMNATSTLTVNPTRTLSVDVSATANFNGQSVTFLSDNTGTASLGQIAGTLSGATNVTVERYIPNNGFRSWRLLSVPTQSSRTIRQSWQEGDANPLPKDNNLPNRGTQITGVFATQAAAAAAGFDSTSVQAGMLRWNGSAWSNITSTNQAINNFNSYFLYIRGERSLTVTGAVSNSSATTLRTIGTVYTGDQTTSVGASAFALVPNLYPSAINFTGLTRTGGVNNLFYIWDSKKQSGSSLGTYQTFSATNNFNCLISGGSYTFGQPNTTIESGQSFFVTSGAAGTIVLKESAKISGTNGSLGFRPTVKTKLDTRLYNSVGEMADANTVVFDAAYGKAVAEEDAPKMGNPGANFAIESEGKLLAIEGTQPVKEGDAIQFRMWNLSKGEYTVELAASNIVLADGVTATLEDSYLKTSTAISLSEATKVKFEINNNAGSSAANRFKIVFGKAKPVIVDSKQTFTVAPNPIETGVMNVQFKNQAAGKYSIRLVATGGQSVMVKTVSHAGGNATQNVNLPSGLASGTYTVEIVAPNKTRSTQTVFVNRK